MRHPPGPGRARAGGHDEVCLEAQLTMDLITWATSSPNAFAQADIDRCLGLGEPTIDGAAEGPTPPLPLRPVGEDACPAWDWPVHVPLQADHE